MNTLRTNVTEMVFTENKDKASKIIREPKDNFPIVVFRDGV